MWSPSCGPARNTRAPAAGTPVLSRTTPGIATNDMFAGITKSSSSISSPARTVTSLAPRNESTPGYISRGVDSRVVLRPTMKRPSGTPVSSNAPSPRVSVRSRSAPGLRSMPSGTVRSTVSPGIAWPDASTIRPRTTAVDFATALSSTHARASFSSNSPGRIAAVPPAGDSRAALYCPAARPPIENVPMASLVTRKTVPLAITDTTAPDKGRSRSRHRARSRLRITTRPKIRPAGDRSVDRFLAYARSAAARSTGCVREHRPVIRSECPSTTVA